MQQQVYLLDYGAGNTRSVINAITKLGFKVIQISHPSQIETATRIVFPGVGDFGQAMNRMDELGYTEPLKQYLLQNRPFMGICVGMQCLFDSSEESSQHKGLGLIPGSVVKFSKQHKSVPHIGWNAAKRISATESFVDDEKRYYFVHSFAVVVKDPVPDEWAHTWTTYGDETFVSSVAKGNVFATQFHPEKSGLAGLSVLSNFLSSTPLVPIPRALQSFPPDSLSKRVIACLDVRSNDQGDLVVTKGDQYDVRETGSGQVRNLGKPVELAERYYKEGADEVTFLNITSFRDCPVQDIPMLQVLQKTSESVFVPLTIGGGIRDIRQPDGTIVKAIDVAGEYFRSGADKVSIGSEAVMIAEAYAAGTCTPQNTITEISQVYGAQAVVISVDPKRVYVSDPSATTHHTIQTTKPGPNGEKYCWYQCTVKGGREARDLDVVQLTTACEALGAGEILLNCMDHDGMNQGYDLELIQMVKDHVKIPVIASSGAGAVEHFDQVFAKTGVEAALAAGIFHRQEVAIEEVKEYLSSKYPIRR